MLWLAPIAGLLLSLPTLNAGLLSEDYWQGVASRNAGWFTNLFGEGLTHDQAIWANYAAKNIGALPWIAVEDLRIAFYRPFSSLLIKLDWTLWPGHPVVMHAHSLLWYTVLLVAAALVYRRLLVAPWAAALAALAFAVDPGHGTAVAWLASRNEIVAGAMGLIALWLHDRARRDGWRLGKWLCPVFVLLSLFGAELGLGAVAYLLAYLWFVDRAPRRARLLASAPWLGAVACWALIYKLQRYGAYGSGVYLDPLGEPKAYLQQLPVRWAAFVYGSLTRYPCELFEWSVGQRGGVVAVVVTAAAVSVLLWQGTRRDPSLRFWGLGTLLSALTVCSTGPSARVALFPLFGALGWVVGSVLAVLKDAHAARGWRWFTRFTVVPLALFHVVLPALLKPLVAVGLPVSSDLLQRAANDVYGSVAPRQDVVILDAPDYYTGTAVVVMGWLSSNRHRARSRIIYAGGTPAHAVRVDAHTLRVDAAQGFMNSSLSRTYRGRQHPMRVGQGLQLNGAQLVVVGVNSEGNPTSVEFRGAEPLDDPRYHWVAWDGERYRSFAMPQVGSAWTTGKLPGPG